MGGAVALLEPSLEDVARGGEGEAEEEQERPHRLAGVVGHLRLREFDHLHQLALARREPRAQHRAHTAAVGRRRHAGQPPARRRRRRRRRRPRLALLAVAVGGDGGGGGGDERGAREQRVHAVPPLDVQQLGGAVVGERVLHLGHRLAGERRLVHEGGAAQDDAVAWNDFGRRRQRRRLRLRRRRRRLRRAGGGGGGDGGRLVRRLERDQVAGEELGRRQRHPLFGPEDEEGVRLGGHPREGLEGALALEDGGALEHQDHEDLEG